MARVDHVSLNKITRQLRREAVANPKKAGVLGLLAVVALWFWAPLVAGWFADEDAAAGAKDKTPTKVAAALKPSAAIEDPAAVATQRPQEVQHSWQQLVQWMDDDPRMSPPVAISTNRDPFASVDPPKTEEELEKESDENTLADATPEGLGMVLSSTIVGPARRVAMINGRPYAEGKIVRLDKGGQQIEFKLAEVHLRSVWLERDGERFELKAAASAHSGRIELLGDAD